MQRLFRMFFYSLMTITLMTGNTYAKSHASPRLVHARKVVENLTQSIDYVKKNSNLAVIFPAEVPEMKKTKLFASQSSLYDKPDYNQYWEISVGTELNCHAHFCQVGSVSAKKDGKLEMDYTQAPFGPDNKPILKQKVKLANNLTGYFTPGHAEADFHAPTMEWQANNVLYILTWQIQGDEKQILTTMANTAIKSAQQ